MSLYPFTPKGVQDKLEQLYDLPDDLLLIEEYAIESDFSGWMLSNFNLNMAQHNYLDGIAEEAVRYYGAQCALCFRHRLDIVLIYPTPTPGYSKVPETKNTIQMVADNHGNVEVIGSLTFTMIYR